ncbi:hypothetical protein N7445_004232, partial [Penicillium cf. griseofulvum]
RALQSFVVPVDLSTYLERLRVYLCFPRRSINDVIDLSSTTDSNTSGPNIDTTNNSDSREALNSTELITLESTYLPNNRSRPSTRLKRPVPRLADASILPDFSNNPDNDIDEDIINDNLVEVLREVTPNNVYRFFNYYIKLKYSEGGRYLKGISKASALKANWKGFRGYYRRIIRTRITTEDSEEINIPLYIYIRYTSLALSLRSPYAFLYRAPSKAVRLRRSIVDRTTIKARS